MHSATSWLNWLRIGFIRKTFNVLGMIDYNFGGIGVVRILELESNLKSREDRVCQDYTARLVVVEWGLKLK